MCRHMRVRAAVRGGVATALAVFVALAAAGRAAAAVPPGYSVWAIGDSVTSGFGYCGTNDTVCGGPQDSLMSPLNLFACVSPPLDDKCSSNYDNPTGLGSQVSWALQFVQAEGIKDFENYAVQGSTPADWDTGGQLNSRLAQLVAANPNLVLMTLGANPILSEFYRGTYLPCIVFGTNEQVRTCARQALAANDTVAHLKNVYASVLSSTQARIVVFRYHDPVPLVAALLAIQPKVEIVLREIDDAVSQAVSATQTRFPGRIAFLRPADSPWPLDHQCTAVQALAVLEWLFSHEQHGLAPWDVSTPWVISGDTCIHPSIAGYTQFAAPLIAWFDSGGSGLPPSAADPPPPLLRVNYRPIQIGPGHPRVEIKLAQPARLTIRVGRDACLQEEVDHRRACSGGRSTAIHLHHLMSLQGHAGSRARHPAEGRRLLRRDGHRAGAQRPRRDPRARADRRDEDRAARAAARQGATLRPLNARAMRGRRRDAAAPRCSGSPPDVSNLRPGERPMPVIKTADLPTGNLKGADHGATISLILDRSEPGDGPRLHKHPYDETWVVIEGNLSFQAGAEHLDAGPGDIVIVPPDTPHKFINRGPGSSSMVCIHASPTFVTEWLE